MSLLTDWWQTGHGSQCRDYIVGWKTEKFVFGFQADISDFSSMNNQQMQLYAVNFIPLLGSLYMFECFIHPSSGVQF